jgi:hypothetical protein
MTELRGAEYIFVASDAQVDASAIERPHQDEPQQNVEDREGQ